MNKQAIVRTRIAPSPTGYPHIGTIYQALFNYAFARKYSGQFLVRIEDTDRDRFVPDAQEKLFAALDWFELIEDESPRKGGKSSPYRQSERLEIYKKYADELITKDVAYYCFCTRERLEEVRKREQQEKKLVMYDKHCRKIPPREAKRRVENKESYVVRMKVPQNLRLTYKDEIRGEITVDSNTVDDQVIIKSDGFPTYHLAVVVDDHLMEITHVLRGSEWLSSTPKHFLLYDYFKWKRPLFFHTPLLSNPDHSKLSKRHGHTDVSWYQDNGFLPEAILNFLALLGWSHPQEKEIFSLDEFIKCVELKDLKPVSPVFDLTKLTWMNQQYIQNLDNTTLKAKLTDFYRENDIVRNFLSDQSNTHNIDTILNLAKTRMERLGDFFPLIKYFLVPPNKDKLNDEHFKVIPEILAGLEAVSVWKKDEIFNALKSIMSKRMSVRMPLFYVLFTGNKYGLPLPDMLEILGKEKTISRLRQLQ